MFDTKDPSFDAMAQPAREAFEFWISFFPTAPLFGVEWRFAGMMPQVDFDASAWPPANAQMWGGAPFSAPTQTMGAEAEAIDVAIPPETAEISAPAIEPDVEPVEETVAEPAPLARPATLMDTAPDAPSDLKLIKGIGPGLERQLNGLGVYTFEQIAAFAVTDLEWVNDNLTSFKGRCFRDDWIGQARALVG